MKINPDNSILRFMTCIFDVILVTVLFLVCCLPVFTAGAAASAMYSTMIAVCRNSCSGVLRHFFGAFRDNFRQATLLWLLAAAAGLVVIADVVGCFAFEMEATVMLYIMRGLTIFCAALYTSLSIYVFSGIAVYRVTWKQAISNALILTMQKLPLTLCLLAIQAVMLGAVVMLWLSAFPFIALGLYLQAKLLTRILELPKEEATHVEEEIDYG